MKNIIRLGVFLVLSSEMGVTYYFTTVIGYKFDITCFPKIERLECGCRLDDVAASKKYCSECGAKIVKKVFVCLPEYLRYEDGDSLYYINGNTKLKIIAPDSDSNRVSAEVFYTAKKDSISIELPTFISLPKFVYFPAFVKTITDRDLVEECPYPTNLDQDMMDLEKTLSGLLKGGKITKGIFLISDWSC